MNASQRIYPLAKGKIDSYRNDCTLLGFEYKVKGIANAGNKTSSLQTRMRFGNAFVGEKKPAFKDGETDSDYYVMKQIIYPALQGGDI